MDGILAEIVLLTLTNQQVRALQSLDQIVKSGPSPVESWARGLRLRMTQDWRLLPNPALASRLERVEYFRARRFTAWGTRAEPYLTALNAGEEADWMRFLQIGYEGVEDGLIFSAHALDSERRESAEVFKSIHEVARDPADADLNVRATRCVTPDGPQVLPWGAWAEFSQRHLAMLVGKEDRFFTIIFQTRQALRRANCSWTHTFET